MTMIGIAVRGDHAEILTDSGRYTRLLTRLGTSSKVRHYTHLDAALVTQGDAQFGAVAAAWIDTADVATLDELLEGAPTALTYAWDSRTDEAGSTLSDPIAFLVGYSHEAGEFKGYALPAETGFTPEPFEFFVVPMPWKSRPTDLELNRFKAFLAEHHPDREDTPELMAVWTSSPVRPVPQEPADWVDLAKDVREQRALVDYGRVSVSGKVHLARIGRGTYRTRVVHEFNDRGAEFQALVMGTMHPQSQLGPCGCGSGVRYIDCHLAPWLDKPCDCGSGQNLRECCAVDVGDPAPVDAA